MTALNDSDALTARIDEAMPQLTDELATLVSIASVSGADQPIDPVLDAQKAVIALLKRSGVSDVRTVEVEGVPAPLVMAEIPGPADAPTILLYTHYDVVPPGELDRWNLPPFEPIVKDGAMYGRGTADSKGNIVAIAGALAAFDGAPPVNIKLVFEGQEEVGSRFDEFPGENPDLFACDAMVIADVGSVREGIATFTSALRGSVRVKIEVNTLKSDKHSGEFGGAAPDSRTVLIKALATLHDENGDVAVEGLRREPWSGETFTEDEFRDLIEILPGVPLQGTGDLGSRIWSGPAITITSFDAPPTTSPINAVASHAAATLNVRVHPEQDPEEASQAVVDHLAKVAPFGVELKVTPGEVGNGFFATTGGPAYEAAKIALQNGWGTEPVMMAAGGSIPVVNSLSDAVPDAEVLLFGVCDTYANIHAPNERVLLSELRAATIAMASFFVEFGKSR